MPERSKRARLSHSHRGGRPDPGGDALGFPPGRIAVTTANDHATFLRACEAFLIQGLVQGRWTYWVATDDATIVSHIFIQHIPKVPKPNRLDDALGYVTNVYTRPAYRNRGIGTQLMARVLGWAAQQDLESLIVWPSEASVPFYVRAGFQGSTDMLEYLVRPYVL